MGLKIIFFPPLDHYAGAIKELEIMHPTSVADVLQLLTEQIPDIEPYTRFEKEDRHPQGLLIWRSKNLLTLTSMLDPEDEIELIPMVSGG